MNNKLSSNNIFAYATSELSQDAFICWLLSFAMEENSGIDLELQECAVKFINHFYPMKPSERVTAIKKQYKNIDVLIEIGDVKIIIEDKTSTKVHNNQISRYRDILLSEGVPKEKIICVYYKIEEQDNPQGDVDFEFTREVLLDLFRKYSKTIQNDIFKDYVYYLEWIDRDVKSYSYKPISNWTGSRAYIGFFKHLIQDSLIKSIWSGWGYVNNPSGGFWGLWWGPFQKGQLDQIGILEKYVDELYLQIENDIIAVKMSLDSEKQYDKELVAKLRRQLLNYFKKEIGYDFKVKKNRPGKTMTLGYITYNESDYRKKINIMQDTMLRMLNGKFKFMD